MNEKNKLTNGSQSNQNENNYPNLNSSDYNNFENNSSNQYYFEEENYNNNKNFENYNYNNQEQYYNNNYDSNYPNNSNYNGNNEQNSYYNNDYNQNIDGNNNQFSYNNQEQFPNYNDDFNSNNEQVFYNNQEQFPNYNNDYNGNNGNNEQNFYNNQEQYSNIEQNDSVSYPSTNSTLTDVPQEETQNTQDILMARELQKTQESEKYQEIQDNQEPSDNKPSKSKLGVIITSIIGLIILLSAGGYFAYNHINKNKEIAINMSQYELEFTASGTEGEGKPSANIKNIPNVDNASDELKQLLQNPKISYDKNDNLRNGDKVEVTLSLDKSELNGKKIVIKDEFKRRFTVKGLKEKDKETTETKENSNNDSNSSSSDKSTSKTNSRVKEDSSVDTTKLSEEQVKNWVLASYIQLLPDMTKDDYIVSVSLHSDNLVYAVISENPNSSKHPSPKMLPTRYRINAKGELEASSRMTEDWRVISKVYMYVE